MAADRDLVFLSYSHDDREWLRRFRIMLQGRHSGSQPASGGPRRRRR